MQIGTPIRQVCSLGLAAMLAGCASMYGGANLSDDTLKSEISASLGMSPGDLTIVSRRSEGVNTYINVKTKSGKDMVCRLMGGGVMTMGFKTAPACNDIATGKVESSGACNELLRAAGQCGNPEPAQASAAPAAAAAPAPAPPAPAAVTAVVTGATAASPPTSAPPSMEPVRMDRTRIAKAQSRLRELGFDAGAADGAIGAKTVQAIREFQSAKKLQVTGTFDAATVRELGI